MITDPSVAFPRADITPLAAITRPFIRRSEMTRLRGFHVVPRRSAGLRAELSTAFLSTVSAQIFFPPLYQLGLFGIKLLVHLLKVSAWRF
jgi:hypothetical protein